MAVYWPRVVWLLRRPLAAFRFSLRRQEAVRACQPNRVPRARQAKQAHHLLWQRGRRTLRRAEALVFRPPAILRQVPPILAEVTLPDRERVTRWAAHRHRVQHLDLGRQEQQVDPPLERQAVGGHHVPVPWDRIPWGKEEGFRARARHVAEVALHQRARGRECPACRGQRAAWVVE
jgi:hypothetical protein